MNAKNKRLMDQEKALDSFFDALLRDVEAYADQEAADDTQASTSSTLLTDSEEQYAANVHDITPRQQTASTPLTLPPAQVAEELAAPSIFEQIPAVEPDLPEVELAPVNVAPAEPVNTAKTHAAPEPEPEPEVALPALGKPTWAEHDFQAMLFKVAGLTLAVPLVDLNGVIEWDDEKITEMPGHADFYLGLRHHLGKNIPLVDTAKLVLPPDKIRALAGDDPLAQLTRIVLIHDSAYGLACDEVNEVITLKPEDVRWRTSRTQRRWLAGTVVEHMCALIDASAFASLLKARSPVDAFRE